jgi:murein DD-endopeptidase MepM/ murein hydrolase activator NlpD
MGLLEKAEIHNQHPPRRQQNLEHLYVKRALHSFCKTIKKFFFAVFRTIQLKSFSFVEKYHIDVKHSFCLLLALVICYFQLFNVSALEIFSQVLNREMIPVVDEQLAVRGGLSAELDQIIIGAPEPEAYSKAQMVTYVSYKVAEGDIIGKISENFGLNQDTILSINGIRNSRLIQIGQVLKIPNQDGIMYTVKSGDTISAIAEKHESDIEAIQTANELFSDTVHPDSRLFLPGAQLNMVEVQEINGDLFIWPINGWITSLYGSRSSPFTGVRQFHTGLDIGSPSGTPIKAAMSGRVAAAGFDNVLGNHVVITHHSGYRTLYAHMSVIRAKAGSYVRTGDRIGDVGSTGLSTGPHLHFTVYKNGVTVNPRQLMK